MSRAPHGARGLKWFFNSWYIPGTNGRAPHGARGLKYVEPPMRQGYDFRSRPAWGAWIEITTVLPSTSMRMSRPARGAWIEIP